MRKLLTLFFVSLLLTTRIWAATIQVSPTGASSGTTQPYNLSWAISQAGSGDILELAAGTYSSVGSITVSKSLTIKASASASTKPIIQGAQFTMGGSYSIYFDGIEAYYDAVGAATPTGAYFLILNSGIYTYPTVSFTNSILHGYGRDLIRADNSTNIATITNLIMDNCFVHDMGRNSPGYSVFGVKYAKISNATITNSTFYNCQSGLWYAQDATTAIALSINKCNIIKTNYYTTSGSNGLFYSSGVNASSTYSIKNTIISDSYDGTTTSNAKMTINVSSNKLVLDSLMLGNNITTSNISSTHGTPYNTYVPTALSYTTPGTIAFTSSSYKISTTPTSYRNIGDARWTLNPTIVTLGTTNMSGFSYNYGTGPSSSQTVTISATALRSSIVLTAPTDYEISTDGSSYSGSLSLGSSGNDLTSTIIYMRLKSGLSIANYNNETISVVAAGALDQTVTCSGSVTNALTALSTPTGLSASSPTYNGFHASWSAVANASSYTVRVYQGASVISTITGITGASTDFTGLTQGSTYTFTVTAIGDALNYNNSIDSSVSNSATILVLNLYTSVNTAGAGTVTKSSNAPYVLNASVNLTATKNFGYAFVNWVDSISGAVLSSANPYTVTMDGTKHIKAVFNTLNTYKLTVNLVGGAKGYMVTASPAATVVNGNNMYEDGTVVTLTASNNSILTFSNWSSGSTNSTLQLTMNQDQSTTATYSAVDYLVGWDFYTSGNSSRPADFYSTSDNSTSTLVMRKADGTGSFWLDKSTTAANGYYNRGAAVNWQPIANRFYYQTSFVATDFTSIKVIAGLLYNYNAYQIQKCEYSLDGTNFTTLDTYTMTSGQTWYDKTISLPAECDHASRVYVRWIPDYTSSIVGTTSANDGTAISSIYITGTKVAYNDGLAPSLSSSVPASSGTGVSATGKVVLNFSKNVQIANGTTATVGSKTLTPVVSGKTISFSYSGLSYNTTYTFTLPAGTVSDAFANTLSSAVTFSFTTMSHPTVTKKNFDFVVGVDGDFAAALAAATSASSSGNRFRVFFPNGTYNIGSITGNANQMTTIALPNVSYIGQSESGVILANLPTTEGISSTATIAFTSAASNNYMQDITLQNNYPYNSTTGRAVALWDQGNKNIYKNVKLLSYQDTYYSGSAIRSYFENSEIHGVVDFLCGGGDVYFNNSTIYVENRSGSVITAPATTTNWGYVFNNCTIDGAAGDNGNYYLGRPWNNAPKAVYINTTMNIQPASAGWTTMGSTPPSVFAEYNSVTSSGATVDVSSRMTTYTYNGVSTSMTPVLTAQQAANYTIDNVLAGNDAWQPTYYTDQLESPAITGTNRTINWADNNYASCWGVFRNGIFVQFTTTNSYTIPANTVSGSVFTVRAANEMGGLSTVSNSYTYIPATQSTDYFRSTATGNLSTVNTWQSSPDGVNWIPATAAPTNLATSISILNGNTLTADVNYTLANLTLNTGSTLNVNSNVQLTVTGTLSNSGSIHLCSDSTSTATMITPATITNGSNSNVTVDQYLTGTSGSIPRGWWYVSSPVSNATAAVFIPNGSTNKFGYWDESTCTYPQITDNTTLMNTGQGYVFYNPGADATVSFTGTLNTGDITVNVTRTGTTNGARGFNLIGNPYPSYVNWNAATKTNVRNTIWYRTWTKGGSMQFDTYDGSTGTANGMRGAVSQYIPPMQGFWVKVDADPVLPATTSTGSILFHNVDRLYKDQTLQSNRLRTKADASVTPGIVRLRVSNGMNADETILVSDATASDAVDSSDSPKMKNNNAEIPEIYTVAGSEEMVINHLNNFSVGKSLTLGFRPGKVSDFSISANEISNVDNNLKVVLQDNATNTEYDLTDGSAYTFSADATATTSRFTVMFKSVGVVNGLFNNELSKVNVYCNAQNQIALEMNTVSGNGSVAVYNSIGQKLVGRELTFGKLVIDNKLKSGVYVVELNINGQRLIKKVVLK
jgi:pectin methylesterase-like acyl-CoA thioesterase